MPAAPNLWRKQRVTLKKKRYFQSWGQKACGIKGGGLARNEEAEIFPFSNFLQWEMIDENRGRW